VAEINARFFWSSVLLTQVLESGTVSKYVLAAASVTYEFAEVPPRVASMAAGTANTVFDSV
jgi:hypothetical protein